MYTYEFDQNPPIVSLERAQTTGYASPNADRIHTHTKKCLPLSPQIKKHSSLKKQESDVDDDIRPDDFDYRTNNLSNCIS